MRPYSAYKESGVPWLGKVPESWKQMRLRDAVEGCLNGIWGEEPSETDDDTPVVRVADFDRQARLALDHPTIRSIPRDQRNGRELFPGDLLIEKSGGGDLQPVGMVVQFQGASGAVSSNFVARMRPRDGIHSRFLVYVHAHFYTAGVSLLSVKQSTGIQNLDGTAYLSERCFLPSFVEQEAIANYLDSETARIDALIAEKGQLIELLREYRRTVISDTVTRGLNHSAPMKPSRVPWLGEIPVHWEACGLTKKLDSIVDYRGRTPTKTDTGVFLVTAKNIGDGRIDYDASQEFIAEDEYDEVMRRGLPAIGDVLFTTEAPLGEVANVDRENIALAQRIIKFRGKDCVLDNYFLKYWLMSKFMQDTLWSWSSGSTAEGIKASRLVRLPLVLPPFDEQQDIVRHIDTEVDHLDALATHVQHEMGLLRELRSSTITDAVLGRFRVA